MRHSVRCNGNNQLPRDHIIGENTRPAWVFRPTCGWVETSSGDKISLDARYGASERLAKRLLERTKYEEILKEMEDYAKYLGLVYSGGR